MGEAGHGVGGGKHACAATFHQFVWIGVGRAVCAKEKARIARGCGRDQGKAVGFAFGHGQAVVMGADATREDVVAVDDQVVGCDGGGEVLSRAAHVIDAVFGGDVFRDDAKVGKAVAQGIEHGFDEGGFAIENVDAWVSDLAVDAQGAADFCHFFKDVHDVINVFDARSRVCCGPCGIEFHGRDEAIREGRCEVGWVRCFCEVKRHQRLEIGASGQRGHDAGSVGGGVFGGDNGRHEVGHDDRTGEITCGFWGHCVKHVAVAQMEVPIVWAGDGECGHRKAPLGVITLIAGGTGFGQADLG